MALESTKRLPLGGSHHFELLNKSLNLKYAQHKNNLSSTESIQYIMENHTHCATNYRDQITFLEQVYNEERAYQLEEERKKNEALYGVPSDEAKKQEESKVACSAITYKSRTQRQNELIAAAEGDSIDREDHVIQLPWTVEAPPTEEELKKR